MSGDIRLFDELTAITGKDLYFLRFRLGLTGADMCWVFGISEPQWSEVYTSRGPLDDPGDQAVAKLLDKRPQYSPVSSNTKDLKKSLIELSDLLSETEVVSESTLSNLFGRPSNQLLAIKTNSGFRKTKKEKAAAEKKDPMREIESFFSVSQSKAK